jgi:hypothetical protein
LRYGDAKWQRRACDKSSQIINLSRYAFLYISFGISGCADAQPNCSTGGISLRYESMDAEATYLEAAWFSTWPVL